MKKLALLGLALAVSLGLASASWAASSDKLTIYVTVSESGAGIELLFGPDYYFGNMTVNERRVDGDGTQVRIFRNIGSTTSDWQMQMGKWQDGSNTDLATQWTYLTDDPANPTTLNHVRVSALWQLTKPSEGDFLADDTVEGPAPDGSPKTCSATVFGLASTSDDEKGFNVPVSGERQVHLMLHTPASGSANLGISVHSELVVTAQ